MNSCPWDGCIAARRPFPNTTILGPTLRALLRRFSGFQFINGDPAPVALSIAGFLQMSVALCRNTQRSSLPEQHEPDNCQ